jgi:hydroxysqualene dehydroxylase
MRRPAGPLRLIPTIHVVGAGLAGLAAALSLSERPDVRVVLHEATGRAGGRCWSFFDERLGRWIDNGNHLILSGNRSVIDHVTCIGAADRLKILHAAAFPFRDIARNRSWTLRIPRSPLTAVAGIGLPGAGPGLVLDMLRLLASRQGRTVAEAISDRGAVWRTFWQPLTVSVLNAPPEEASSALLANVLRRTVLRGAQDCRPVLVLGGLQAALVEPAIKLLLRRGVEVRYRDPLVGIGAVGDRAASLQFPSGGASLRLSPDDHLVLAAPPDRWTDVLGITVPAPGYTITNAHFVVAETLARRLPDICGIVGGTADWLFRRGDVVSVTVSAAERTILTGMSNPEALAVLWNDVLGAAGCSGVEPLAARLLRERAATWAPSPENAARRPPMQSRLKNVLLAGDHVASPLPATLEAAVRSGRAAAEALQPWPRGERCASAPGLPPRGSGAGLFRDDRAVQQD